MSACEKYGYAFHYQNSLCFVCHSKLDKGQEDFNCGCCHPDNSFLCGGKYACQQSKKC